MDVAERKKREPPDSDAPPQPKKQSIVPDSPPEVLDPKDITIIRYQNREMQIRIKELRAELKSSEEKCKKFGKMSENCEETVSCIHMSWDQLIHGLQLLLNNITPSSSVEGLLGPIQSNGPFTSLQIHPHCPVNEDAEISGALQDKVDRIRNLFSSVIAVVHKEKVSSEKLAHMLLETKDPEVLATLRDNSLAERVTLLEQENTHLQTSLSTLQEQNLEYNNKIRLLTARNTKNNQTIDSLQSELNQAKDEIDLLRRKAIKTEFPPFAGLSAPKPSPLQSSGSSNTSNTSPVLPLQPTNSKEAKENNNSALEAELAEMQALAESRLEEIKKLNSDRQQYMKELRALRGELEHLPAERVQLSSHYLRLQKEVQSLNNLVDEKDNQIKNCKAEMNRLNTARRTDIQQVESTEFARRRLLDKQIAELESRVSSLIADRTDLIAKLEHQLASNPSRSYVDELKQLLASKDSDIRKSRDECERLRETNKSLVAKEERRRPDKAEDFIQEKENEIRDLVDRLRDASKALDDIKHKEKKWAEREHDYKIMIENFQTLSKESRALADLRISERRLRDEVDDLRRHNDDLRRQLDKYSSRMDASSIRELEKKHSDELRAAKHEQEKRIAQLESENKKMRSAVDSQKQENELMLAEIENISKSYEAMQSQNTRLMQQLGEKEDATTKIIAESMKQKKDALQALEEAKFASTRVAAVMERNQSQAAEILKCQDTTQSLYEHINKLQEELHHATSPQDSLRTKLADSERVNQAQAFKLEQQEKLIQDYKGKLEDAAADLEREKERLRRLEEDKNSLKRKLEKYPSKLGSSSNGITLAEEELRLLKQRMRCSVCNDRTKDTVIARCFHVFCHQCIQINLQQRKRRCPGCTNKFSETDVHSLYDFAS